jgi:uncharacterized protein (TIGR04145 family)
MITGVVNLDGSANEDTFSGIVYDGLYGDWTYYPHTTLQYATAGTQEKVTDSKGALYVSGTKLYGHVVTSMPTHLQEAGGEFTSSISVCFNGNRDWDQNSNFYPRMVAVDENGNINWDPQLSGLANGTYEFYLASSDAWHTSTNINALNAMDQMYGRITITVGDTKNECEFYLDLEKIAEKLGCDASDFKVIEAQFGRLGQQWISTAGSSSGAWMGILICLLFTGCVLFYKKRRKGEVPTA